MPSQIWGVNLHIPLKSGCFADKHVPEAAIVIVERNWQARSASWTQVEN